MDNPLEQIRSIPARMLLALRWHGISLIQAPAALQHLDLPVRNLADLADPQGLLAALTPATFYEFARTYTTSTRWLESGRGEVVDLSYLNFVPGVFVTRAQEQAQRGVLQDIYLLAMHPYMSLTEYRTAEWNLLEALTPRLEPGEWGSDDI